MSESAVSTGKPVGKPVDASNAYLRPEHLAASRWVALPELGSEGFAVSWQDVSVRPEGPHAGGHEGFTVALCTDELLEEDFAEGVGPHPRERLPAGEDFALDVGGMAVYLARSFTNAEALALTELLLREAGIPVASLAEVGRDEFYGASSAAEVEVKGP